MKNILMSSAGLVGESSSMLQKHLCSLQAGEVHDAVLCIQKCQDLLQTAQDALQEGCTQCYEQQSLRYYLFVECNCVCCLSIVLPFSEVVDDTYKLNLQQVEIGHELQIACRQAKLITAETFRLEVDTTLMKHILQNAQSNVRCCLSDSAIFDI